MTTYTIEIDGNALDFINVMIERTVDGSKIDTWNAVLASASESVSLDDSVNIKRNNSSIFQGIVEVIEPQMSSSGSAMVVTGRQNKIKLWRKWSERYADFGGAWTNYYLTKVISFLLRPSFSDKPIELKDTYRRIGWGISPKGTWIVTASGTDSDHDPQNVANRLATSTWKCDINQANTEWIKVNMGSAKTICGIRIELRKKMNEFIRNYKIETSINNSDWTEVVSEVTNNRAINIVESWTPASAQWVRISCTQPFADSWSISNIFLYESDGAITGISEGTITEHLPLNCSLLSSNVTASDTVEVKEGWRFSGRRTTSADSGDYVIIADDNSEEYAYVKSVSGNTITLESATSGNFTTAANGLLLNIDRGTEVNIEYVRRTVAIDKLVKLMSTDSIPWQWEVTDAGAVNVGARIGTDNSGSITFAYQTNLLKSNNKQDNRKRVDRVLVLGGGKGDIQDRISSGWQGSGNYEMVVVDQSLKTEEACITKAKTILAEYSSPTEVTVVVNDAENASGSWGIGDDITLTDAVSGLSGSYRTKKISRGYSASSETVTINCTFMSQTSAERVAKQINKLNAALQAQDVYSDYEFDDVIAKAGISQFYEAEELVLDPDVTIETNLTDSNLESIKMDSANSGNVFWGPGAPIQASSYRVLFKCKVTSNASSSNLITLDVYSLTNGSTYATRTIAPDIFSSSDTWEIISFNFTVPTTVTDLEIRANTFVNGITDFYCDWVGIAPNAIVDDPPGPPSAPTNPSASAVIDGVLVIWDAVVVTDFSYYILYRDTSPTATTEYARMYVNKFTDRNVSFGTTYYYRIKAVDWAGNVSGYSSEVSAAPDRIDPLDLDIEIRPWIADFGVDYTGSLPNVTLRWGSAADTTVDGEVTFSDGATVTGINFSTQGLTIGSTKTYWLYWDESQMTLGDYDIQLTDGTTADYGTAVGSGKGVLAVVQLYSNGTTKPTVLLFNSYLPTITAGVIAANTITAAEIAATTITAAQIAGNTITASQIASNTITADEITTAWLTALNIRTSATGAMVEISSTGIIGKNSLGATQFSILNADGTATFGGGVGIINSSGIIIDNTDDTVFLKFTISDVTKGTIFTDGGPATDTFSIFSHNADLYIHSRNEDLFLIGNTNVSIIAGGTITLNSGSTIIIMDPIDLRGNIIPDTTGARDLGSSSKQFGEIWGRDKIQGLHYSSTGDLGIGVDRVFTELDGTVNTVQIRSGLIVSWTQV